MGIDAAGLQRAHDLEGAPDPFPSLNDPSPAQSKPSAVAVDAESKEAFPSLSSSSAQVAPKPAQAAAPSKVAWSAATGPRLRPVQAAPQATESFTLTAIDLSAAGKDGKPTTLGEIMKQVMAKHKVRIEASSNQRARQTTFNLKADSKKELEKAKRTLLASLSPVVRSLALAKRLGVGALYMCI